MPTLYTALTSGADAANETIYATSTNPFVLEKDSIVELIVNNEHMGRHPFHLHGHHFQAVFQSKHRDGLFIDQDLTEDDLPRTPIRRDTLVVNPGGSIVVRFRANNPGSFPPIGILPAWCETLTCEFIRSLAIPLPHGMACPCRTYGHNGGRSSYTPGANANVIHSL